MKQINKIIFFLVFTSFICSSVFSNNNIVFLDIEYSINNSNIGKKVFNDLNKIQLEENKKLKKIEESLKKKDQEINSIKNVISQNELKNKINILKKEINKYNIKKDEVQKEFINNKNNQFNELFKKINPLIIKYMSDNSIEIILSKTNVYLGKIELDITENIIKLINENF